jgi:uncharacterized membrane protein YkoI
MLCLPAAAERHPGDGAGEHDHERARHALDRGEVRPIAEILAQVAVAVPGEVIAVEFERRGEYRARHGGPGWIYELKILAEDGRLLEVLVDAETGRILTVEQD